MHRTVVACARFASLRRGGALSLAALTMSSRTASSSLVAGSSALFFQRCHFRRSAPLREKEKPTDDEDTFEFDATASVTKDAITATRGEMLLQLVRDMLPEGASEEARSALTRRLNTTPMDQMILTDKVIITHVQNDSGDVDERIKLPPMSRAEAMQQAAEGGKNLVQMAEKDGTAYCRLRREREKILVELAPLLAQKAGGRPKKAKPPIDHAFRDVVDAHFISWRSKKVVQDLRKGHPVKLIIQQFASPHGALAKMREMLEGVEKNANELKAWHHYSGISVSDRELSVHLSCGDRDQQVKHPSERDWDHAANRFSDKFSGSDRKGTYQKKDTMKPVKIGARTFRVDKFGRRTD